MSTSDETTGQAAPTADADTRGQVTPESGDESTRSGTEEMTAAEESGQVAFGAEEPTGETGATGAGSSSG